MYLFLDKHSLSVLKGKQYKFTGRSIRPASFRMYAELDNRPVAYTSELPDILLAQLTAVSYFLFLDFAKEKDTVF